jgi:hypothetical protein
MMHLLFLIIFLAIGIPVALGIELYLRALSRHKAEAAGDTGGGEFMPIPEGSAIALRRASDKPVE